MIANANSPTSALIDLPIKAERWRTAPSLDLGTLQPVVGNDTSLYDELLSLYITDVGERLKRVEGQLITKEHKPLWLELHTIKGSSGTIGAMKMHYCAAYLSEKLRLEPPSPEPVSLQDMAPVFDELFGLFPPTVESIETALAFLRGGGRPDEFQP